MFVYVYSVLQRQVIICVLSLSLCRRRTQSIRNILDEETTRPLKYENVTDKELAKHAQLASTQLPRGPKRPPMPLPRPARPEH